MWEYYVCNLYIYLLSSNNFSAYLYIVLVQPLVSFIIQKFMLSLYIELGHSKYELRLSEGYRVNSYNVINLLYNIWFDVM